MPIFLTYLPITMLAFHITTFHLSCQYTAERVPAKTDVSWIFVVAKCSADKRRYVAMSVGAKENVNGSSSVKIW
ncbi:hypothetical protein HN011_005496 [Eciton burchellii]|nr:hypothetical protein HN011_005496 [Eciton burchellii]